MKYAVKAKFGSQNSDFFVTKNNSNRKPYTFSTNDPDTKFWATKKGAEKWAALHNSYMGNDLTILSFSVIEVEE